MESTSNCQEKYLVIRKPKDLNSEGCRFFVEADNAQETLISSTKLRWLTYNNDDGTTPFTPEQGLAIERIIEAREAREVNNDMLPRFSMRILLYGDPREFSEKDSKHIKSLIKCEGVHVRFYIPKEEQRLRIALKGNKLFLSMSGTSKNEVHEGILYEAASENSPLLKYFKSQFDHDYNKAKEMIVNNKDKIVRADNWIKRFAKWCKSENGMNAMIGGIIGIITTILLYFLLP